MSFFDSVLSQLAGHDTARDRPVSSDHSAYGGQDAASRFYPQGMDMKALKKPTDDEITRAWSVAIRQYGLQSNGNVPVIDSDLVPKVKRNVVDAYHKILSHKIYGSRIYGTPGSGLADSGFGQSEIKSGTKGEEVFAKLLSWDNVLNHCVSFWSVWRPEENGQKNTFGADIDCILKFGDHILMVDVKNYRAGLDYHTLIPEQAMFCAYHAARVVANQPYIFSRNMAFAQHNMARYLVESGSPCTVESFVVLVPGSAGEAVLDPDIRWPGGLLAMSYSSFVNMLKQRAIADPSYLNEVSDKTREEGYLASLVKSYEHAQLSLLSNPLPINQWPMPSYDSAAGIGVQPTRTPAHGTHTRQDERHSRSQGNQQHNAQSQTTQGRRQRGHTYGAHTRKKRSLDRIPTISSKTLEIPCLSGTDSAPAQLSLARKSGIIASGGQGSGSITRILTVVAALTACEGVELRIIDCNSTSCFEQLEDKVASYTRLMDGIDLVSSELQDVYTSLRVRKMKLGKAGLSSFWDDPNHGGLPFSVVYINETSRLFNSLDRRASKDDESSLNDIRRYVGKILIDGIRSGVCIILSTQKPSSDSLPVGFVNGSQLRLCFRVQTDASQKVILGDASDSAPRATDIARYEYGKASVYEDGKASRFETFLPLSDDALGKFIS